MFNVIMLGQTINFIYFLSSIKNKIDFQEKNILNINKTLLNMYDIILVKDYVLNIKILYASKSYAEKFLNVLKNEKFIDHVLICKSC